MRIESSQVSYVTSHRSESTTVVIDEGLVRARTSGADAQRASGSGVPPVAVDTIQLSPVASSLNASYSEDLQDLTPQQRVAAMIIEAMLGYRFRGGRYRAPATAASATTGARSNGFAQSSAPAHAGAAEVHQRTEVHAESEQTRFEAHGVLETADGRSIEFLATLSMDREFQSYSITSGPSQTTDPLVVNLGGTPARLTGAKVLFDLNADGNPESVSFVAAGSGFLALDSNGDGKVNDGRELFGPKMGDGFAELAAYDADQNGWIDENDPLFAKLRIWTQDGLSTLSEKGIGAIYTSSAATPFALKDGANTLQAEIRRSGIYLSENGTAGTIQQVDLAESPPT